ncbi:hypothetical protein GCM10010869_00630 [Mesorhizobium tianshanense]|uniref:hypothetical protein n=1 Tax=Mesorhizobium tianshanense TaxID=39844 RepID=UPI0012DF3EE1|nr:hypothetical protein [Mesorhizobium tianshanense]GLS34475.1 hypothetical protein GCM10010869_00630 [Mesorhizobium tianshanense]
MNYFHLLGADRECPLPIAVAGGETTAIVADIPIGLALIVLSLPRGTRSDQHYGG